MVLAICQTIQQRSIKAARGPGLSIMLVIFSDMKNGHLTCVLGRRHYNRRVEIFIGRRSQLTPSAKEHNVSKLDTADVLLSFATHNTCETVLPLHHKAGKSTCAMAHPNDSTPLPMTAVMICAVPVLQLPALESL